jgi:transposase
VLTAGQVHDATQAQALLAGERAERVIADKASDADRIRQAVTDIGALAIIPPHPRRARAVADDRHLYQERHVIECFISQLKHFRRSATRYVAVTIIGLR